MDPAFKVDVVNVASAPDLGAIPPSAVPNEGRSIEEAQLSAAKDAAKTKIDEIVAAAPQMTAKALVDTAQSLTFMAVRIGAASQGLDYNDRIKALARFDDDEREELLGTAEFALPWVIRVLSNAQVVGALLFGGSLCTLSALRFAALKAEAKKQKQEKAEGRNGGGGPRAGTAGPTASTPPRAPPPLSREDAEILSTLASAQPGVPGGGLGKTSL
jgi:hypothetical protein